MEAVEYNPVDSNGQARSQTCPRCGGPLLSQYGDVSCLPCGYTPVRVPENIVRTLREEQQQLGRGRKKGGLTY